MDTSGYLRGGKAPPSSAVIKECVELYLHSPNAPSWHGAQLKKAQGLYFFIIVCPLMDELN
jgi:hypothetical protein